MTSEVIHYVMKILRLHNVSIQKTFGYGIEEFLCDVEELTFLIRTFDQDLRY